MSCNCSSNCNCNEPIGQNPPQVKVIREATATASGCAIKGWYETLAITSFVPQDFAATQNLTVCDAYQYLPGTCVLLIDTAGNKQVQRVTGRVSATVITLTAYDNADSDESTNLSGTIYAAPLAQCPVASAVAEECQLKNLVTAEAFIIPAADSAVEVTFTESVTLAVGQTIFITGAGYFEVAEPPVGDFEPCNTAFYLTNLGTSGNETPGDTVASGAVGVLTPPPASIASTKGGFRRTVTSGGTNVADDTAIAFGSEDFNTMTGIGTFGGGGSTFTATIAGVFHFDACVRFESGSWSPTPVEAHLVSCVNGTVKAHGSYINGGSADGLGIVSSTLHLAANDVVSIRWLDTATASPAETVDLEGVTSTEISAWSGHLVYAD